MKYYGWILIGSSLIFSACGNNSENSESVPQVEAIAVVIETPTPSSSPTIDPSPTPSPSPAPSDSNSPSRDSTRVFVSRAVVNGQSQFPLIRIDQMNLICAQEAKVARVRGKYVPLVASTRYAFPKKFDVSGKIYQVIGKKPIAVAENFEALVSGKNESIIAFADGKKFNSRFPFVWTGHKDLMQASYPELNCQNWRSRNSEGIVGVVGKSGQSAFADRYLKCAAAAHVYCIQSAK